MSFTRKHVLRNVKLKDAKDRLQLIFQWLAYLVCKWCWLNWL